MAKDRTIENIKKRLLISATSISLALSLGGCSGTPKTSNQNHDESKSTESIENTIGTTVSSLSDITETSNSSIEPSEATKPSIIEDYVGETIAFQEPEITDDLFIVAQRVELGGLEFGFDNPDYCNQLCEQLKLNNVHMYDVGYLQEYYNKLDVFRYVYHSKETDESINFRRQIDMFILENLGLRLYVDEIPYEFFEKNFSDYLELLKPTGDLEYDMYHGLDDVYNRFTDSQNDIIAGSKSIDDFLSKVDQNTDKEMFRFLIFYSAMTYNQKRCSMVYDYHGSGEGDQYKAIYIQQVRTIDGKNVLLFKPYQLDAFMKDMHDQKCYANIENIYVPLTKDDLDKADIEYDKFEHAVVDVAGIDFDLENVKDGTSRA